LAAKLISLWLVVVLIGQGHALADESVPTAQPLNSGRVLGPGLPFSEAVRVGHLLYLSGEIGIAPGTMQLVEGGILAEARQALTNIRLVLESNGRSMDDLVKCTVMLADMKDWPAFNQVWRDVLRAPYPARSAMGVNGLALGARVEIDCIATG
jgi:reactive intermediate/imine deaminase